MGTLKVDDVIARTGNAMNLGVSGDTVTVPSGASLVVTDGIAISSLPTVTVAKGGTGLTSSGSGNQALKMNSGGTALEYGTLPVAGGGTGATTHPANSVLIGAGTSAITSVAPGTTGNVLTSNGTIWTSAEAAGGGIVVQRVFVEDSTLSTSTAVWGWDNTIPQITEGVQTMTLAITPTSASNKLHIEARQFLDNNTAGENQAIALFQDTTANALASTVTCVTTASRQQAPLILNHYMTAGTTSSTTFKIRAGNGTRTHNHTGGSFTINGAAGASTYQLGGTFKSQIMITEYAV